jgi:serpin B
VKQLTLFTLILLLLAAYGPMLGPAEEPEVIEANLLRLAEPDVNEAQLDQLVQANNRFAFELYQAIRQESDDNLIYSPYSISLAFSMVYAGARGQTEAEMA